MRIKKISQTTPVQAEVVNTYSTSQENAYSCDYSNKAFGGTILWTNSSSTQDFQAQTITLNDDATKYDKIEILFDIFAPYDNFWYFPMKYTGYDININQSDFSNNTVIVRNRRVSFPQNNQMQFTVGLQNGVVNNNILVPIKIIGYK